MISVVLWLIIDDDRWQHETTNHINSDSR